MVQQENQAVNQIDQPRLALSSWLLEVKCKDQPKGKLLFKLPSHYWQAIKAIRMATGIFEDYIADMKIKNQDLVRCKILGFCILPNKIMIMIENCKDICIDEYVVKFRNCIAYTMPSVSKELTIDKLLLETNARSKNVIKELILYPLRLGKEPRYYLYSILHYYLGGYGKEWLDFRLLEQIETDEL
ncbi:hypothetical protein KC853_01365 [Candidatus Saccharibacteria bacterium]|nr:hypothetical protein [Candidatus Saccharibacteria bacterium]